MNTTQRLIALIDEWTSKPGHWAIVNIDRDRGATYLLRQIANRLAQRHENYAFVQYMDAFEHIDWSTTVGPHHASEYTWMLNEWPTTRGVKGAHLSPPSHGIVAPRGFPWRSFTDENSTIPFEGQAALAIITLDQSESLWSYQDAEGMQCSGPWERPADQGPLVQGQQQKYEWPDVYAVLDMVSERY